MRIIRYTLLADGTSDEVLIPIITWLIAQHLPEARIVSAFARGRGQIGLSLRQRVPDTVANFPCDLLIVHRDAERESIETRQQEIEDAIQSVRIPVVPLIPVRMTEAWLFSDESAIRFAAGNRSGTVPLAVPRKRVWESIPDPKDVLSQLLREASGKSGRALTKFFPEKSRSLITQRTEDFSALRGLRSFDIFERALVDKLKEIK